MLLFVSIWHVTYFGIKSISFSVVYFFSVVLVWNNLFSGRILIIFAN